VSAFGAFAPFNGSLTTIVPSVDFAGFSPLPFGAAPSRLVSADPSRGRDPSVSSVGHVTQRKKLINARAVSPSAFHAFPVYQWAYRRYSLRASPRCTRPNY
jgi:hypothetical protein